MSFQEITPSEFFYRNRDLAGFSNPARSLYFTLRELVENSLDSCEVRGVPPTVFISVSAAEDGPRDEPRHYKVTVQDNGGGIPREHLANAFGRVFYGSKFTLRQSRGMFGLGVTMSILYGQATTNKPALVASSTDGVRYYGYLLKIDIKRNKPQIIKRMTGRAEGWRGTLVSVTVLGDYSRAENKIRSYLEHTALATPYADLTFRTPDGRLVVYKRVTEKMPRPPRETLPHPYGVDVETVKKLISAWGGEGGLKEFMCESFQRVGEKTAVRFLEYSGLDPDKPPRSLSEEEVIKLTESLRSYPHFLPPDASCLSPLGGELLAAGIKRLLKPEFLAVAVRKPSAYEGHPFIVEVGVAYGGPRLKPGITLYRIANRIPLLYDESSDVSWRVINSLDLSHYKIRQDDPVGVVVHICSTRVPYKTVGKEYVADRPEVEREIRLALREALRRLRAYLSKKEALARKRKRSNVYAKYLPIIARFAASLAGRRKPPSYSKLIPLGEVVVGERARG